MQLELFNDQLELFPDFISENKEERSLSHRKSSIKDESVYIPFLADIEQLSRRSGYCYASNRHFRESNLSSLFGRTDRTIQRHLRALQDCDMVKIDRMGPKRMIFVTTRGMLALEEAGFTPTFTPTRQTQAIPTMSLDPDTMSQLPRQNVDRPRQNVAHISLLTPIPVHKEVETKSEEEKQKKSTEDEFIEFFLPPPLEIDLPPRNIRESLERRQLEMNK